MPFNTRRSSSTRGTPRGLFGSNGSMITHSDPSVHTVAAPSNFIRNGEPESAQRQQPKPIYEFHGLATSFNVPPGSEFLVRAAHRRSPSLLAR
jgi:hypothetical protein